MSERQKMNIAVIFAGGVGERMKTKALPKQFLDIYGKPIIIHTVEKFEFHPRVDAIVIVCVSGWEDYLNDLLHKYHIKKVSAIVEGGETGQLSIYNGIKKAAELYGKEDNVVLIHDGVRPLITEQTITDNIESVIAHGSAITTAIVKETMLVVDSDSNGIDYVTDRKKTRAARAPQSFWLKDIYDAHEEFLKNGIRDCIDSCTMMQEMGKKLFLVDGPDENIKITTASDYYSLRAVLEARENRQIYGL